MNIEEENGRNENRNLKVLYCSSTVHDYRVKERKIHIAFSIKETQIFTNFYKIKL